VPSVSFYNYAERRYAVCRYPQYRYAEWRGTLESDFCKRNNSNQAYVGLQLVAIKNKSAQMLDSVRNSTSFSYFHNFWLI